MKLTADTTATSSWKFPVETDHGVFLAEFTTSGLAGLTFPSRHQKTNAACAKTQPREVRRWLKLTEGALRSSLSGSATGELPPLDWSGATPFQRKVWKALLGIQTGRTASYGELAHRIGRGNAARAVGTACGANPVPVLVPCHRVVAANGGLGGFSGGLAWKRKLLAAERV